MFKLVFKIIFFLRNFKWLTRKHEIIAFLNYRSSRLTPLICATCLTFHRKVRRAKRLSRSEIWRLHLLFFYFLLSSLFSNSTLSDFSNAPLFFKLDWLFKNSLFFNCSSETRCFEYSSSSSGSRCRQFHGLLLRCVPPGGALFYSAQGSDWAPANRFDSRAPRWKLFLSFSLCKFFILILLEIN